MARKTLKPEAPSRVIKKITVRKPSIKNVQAIIDGLNKWVASEKEREINEIDEQIKVLEDKKAKIQGNENKG